MAGIASTRDVGGAGWADIYSCDAYDMERMLNAAIHQMLAATPSARDRYAASAKDSFGKVILERNHESSLEHHMKQTCYQVAGMRTANIKYFPLEPIQIEILESLFQTPRIKAVDNRDARGVIIGDVWLNQREYAMRSMWYNPQEDENWNSKVYLIMKKKHSDLVREVISDVKEVMKNFGLKEGKLSPQVNP